jgi:hypothetical protein
LDYFAWNGLAAAGITAHRGSHGADVSLGGTLLSEAWGVLDGLWLLILRPPNAAANGLSPTEGRAFAGNLESGLSLLLA